LFDNSDHGGIKVLRKLQFLTLRCLKIDLRVAQKSNSGGKKGDSMSHREKRGEPEQDTADTSSARRMRMMVTIERNITWNIIINLTKKTLALLLIKKLEHCPKEPRSQLSVAL
jgi:hypothetical protein